MKKRIYISCNSLYNTEKSLTFLYNRIKNSSLNKCDIFLVHDSKFDLHDLNNDLNVKYIQGLENSFEYGALQVLWDHSNKEEFYGLYLHCKGSSKTDEFQFNNGLAWADFMLYGLIDNVELCTQYLDKGADLVGSMWYRHFKGNFFWGKSTFLRQLWNPLIYYNNIEHYTRYAAEYWISYAYWVGTNNLNNLPYPKIKNLFYMPIQNDFDFLNLKDKNFKPDFKQKYICKEFDKIISENYYGVYNQIILSETQYDTFKDILFKYKDFDCEVVIN